MKLSIKELNKKTAWDKAGITLPVYDVAALHKQISVAGVSCTTRSLPLSTVSC